jgi:hypothetical protein
MARIRLSKSLQHLNYSDVADMFNIREKALRLFYSSLNPEYNLMFVGYSDEEILDELNENLKEIERDACLNLLAAIEAAFRIDYAIRVEERDKDDISRRFRELFQEYQYRMPLEDILFDEWKEHPDIDRTIISELKGAFLYRHWLAHGRYWVLKASRKYYDFYDLYNLALQIDQFPMKRI